MAPIRPPTPPRYLQIPTGFWPTAQGWRSSAYLGSSIPQSLSTPTGLRPCVMPLPGLASTTSRLPKRPPIPDQRWRLPPAPAVRHHCRTPNPIESFSPVGPASSRKRAIRYRSSTELVFAFEPACRAHLATAGGTVRCRQIPTGFWPTAQGWRPSAYLGSSSPNPHQPQRGCGHALCPCLASPPPPHSSQNALQSRPTLAPPSSTSGAASLWNTPPN